MPSCTPSSATTSNSRPMAPDGVVTSTLSPPERGERVSSGTSASSTASRNTLGPESGCRSTNRVAAVNSASTPSRLLFASAARMPVPSACANHASARPLRFQTSQSSSSIVPPDAAERAHLAEGDRQVVGVSGDARVDAGQPPGCRQRVDEELVAAAVAVPGEFLGAQRQAQPPQGQPVQAAERTQQQVAGQLGAERGAADAHIHHREQASGGPVVAQRRAAGRGAGRHIRQRQRTGHGGHLRAAAHDDRHLPPGDVAQQMVLPQPPGDRRGFAGRGAGGQAQHRLLAQLARAASRRGARRCRRCRSGR